MDHARDFTLKPSLDPLMNLVKEEMHAVHQTIWDSVQSGTPLISELSHYIIAAGGKKIRPMITLATSKMLGYQGLHHIDLAASIECIHTATLLHDDVVDESSMRRGNKSANEVWGNKSSVLVGDFLFSKAFQLMLRPQCPDILNVLSNASAQIAEGEVKQLTMSQNLQATQDIYMEIILAKTACLFEAACVVSGHLTNQPDSTLMNLRHFGRALGMTFQLIDDALDYDAQSHEMGKSCGDDFHEQKVTLPLIYLYARASEQDQAFLRQAIEGTQQPDDLKRTIILLKKHAVLKDIYALAHKHAEEARTALHTFPQSPTRDALEMIIDFCLTRRG